MLINEFAKISGDVSLTHLNIKTGWGTQKNKFSKSIFTWMDQLKEGFHHKNTKYIGEMVIWNTQQTRTRGIQPPGQEEPREGWRSDGVREAFFKIDGPR